MRRVTAQEPIKTTTVSWLHRWLPFCCLRPLVVGLCVWVLALWLFVPSRCWVLGAGLGCPGPFPCGWLLPLSSCFRLLYWLSWERATSQEPIPSFHCPYGPLSGIPWYVGSTGASISRAYSYAGISCFTPPSQLRRFLTKCLHVLSTHRRGPVEEPPRAERALRGGLRFRQYLSRLFFLLPLWRPMSHFTCMFSPRAISEVAESLDVRGQFLGTHVGKVPLGVGKNPRPTRTMSGSCRDSPMKKWRLCTFLHSMRNSLSSLFRRCNSWTSLTRPSCVCSSTKWSMSLLCGHPWDSCFST